MAKLIDSSFVCKKMERLLLSRKMTYLNLAKYTGISVLAFPHLKPIATSWSGRRS